MRGIRIESRGEAKVLPQFTTLVFQEHYDGDDIVIGSVPPAVGSYISGRAYGGGASVSALAVNQKMAQSAAVRQADTQTRGPVMSANQTAALVKLMHYTGALAHSGTYHLGFRGVAGGNFAFRLEVNMFSGVITVKNAAGAVQGTYDALVNNNDPFPDVYLYDYGTYFDLVVGGVVRVHIVSTVGNGNTLIGFYMVNYSSSYIAYLHAMEIYV